MNILTAAINRTRKLLVVAAAVDAVTLFAATQAKPASADGGRLNMLPSFACGGTHTRVVKVDGSNAVAELNENNNTVTRTSIYPVC